MTITEHDDLERVGTAEAELIECLQDLYGSWAARGEGAVETFLASLSPEFFGFGTGRVERYPDRGTLAELLRREMEEMPTPYTIRFVETTARLLSSTVGIADAEAIITVPVGDEEAVSFDFRVSVVLQKEDEEWRVVYNHGSIPASEQGEDTMPIDALRARNRELERLVAERTAGLRAAQAQLVHQEKMASLGALTAGIAHEIKNPLNFVTNFAGLAVELADELDDAEGDERDEILADLRDNAVRIAEHGARADAIVSGMMQHAQGGTGARQTVNLNALVAEYAEHARHAHLARDPDATVSLALELADDVGEVELVPQEIGRVVVALIGNAFDAVRERPEVGDPARGAGTVTISTARTASGAEVRVEDDGLGIEPDALGRVFEPFYTTKPTGQGHTGLGLSLAHDIVTQGHGGTLAVESEAGAGATFVLTLPSTDAP